MSDPNDDAPRLLALRETHHITLADGRTVVVEQVIPGPGVDPAVADALTASDDGPALDLEALGRDMAAAVRAGPDGFEERAAALLRRHGFTPPPHEHPTREDD